MSDHGEHEAAQAAHDERVHEAHAAPPPLDEPATPLWLTLLGVGLFLVGGILFAATRPDGKTTAELDAARASAEPPAGAAPTPTPAEAPAGAARQGAGAPPSPAGAIPPAGEARPAPRPQQPGHEGHNH